MKDNGIQRTGVYGLADIKAAIAFDRGKLYGNTTGALITISYNTSFNIGCK